MQFAACAFSDFMGATPTPLHPPLLWKGYETLYASIHFGCVAYSCSLPVPCYAIEISILIFITAVLLPDNIHNAIHKAGIEPGRKVKSVVEKPTCLVVWVLCVTLSLHKAKRITHSAQS